MDTLPRVTLREMTADDIPAVHRVEQAAYGDEAWPETLFEGELRNAFASYTVAEAVGAAEQGMERAAVEGDAPASERAILGYAGVWFMVDQLHIASIAVDPAVQGRGIGQRLLFDCIDRAWQAEMETIALEVRPSNERAVRLYRHFGFVKGGMLRGYYGDGEDALLLLTPRLDDPDWRALIATRRAAHHQRWGAAEIAVTDAAARDRA